MVVAMKSECGFILTVKMQSRAHSSRLAAAGTGRSGKTACYTLSMKNSLLAMAAIALFVGTASSLTLDTPLLVKKMVIHLSGSAQAPPPTPKIEKGIKYPASYTGNREKRKSNGDIGRGHLPKGEIYGEPDKRRIIRSALKTQAAQKKHPVAVLNTEGLLFKADDMTHGTDNVLRITSNKKKVSVNIAQINTVKFGKQELNRLEVTVELLNGEVIEGVISPQLVLEFITGDSVITARANQLNTVKFLKE